MVSRVGRIREQDVVGGNSLVFDCLVEVFSLVINVWKALAHQSLFDASVAVVRIINLDCVVVFLKNTLSCCEKFEISRT